VPAERVTALRRAFDAALKDPALVAEAEKSKIEIDPLSGEAGAELVRQVSATPSDVVASVRAALEKR